MSVETKPGGNNNPNRIQPKKPKGKNPDITARRLDAWKKSHRKRRRIPK